MEDVAPIIDVGMVVTPGRDRRAELRRTLGLSDAEKLVYLYLGRYGQDDYEWERLGRLGGEGVHFVGFHPAPERAGPLPNLHVVPAAELERGRPGRLEPTWWSPRPATGRPARRWSPARR